MLHAGGDYDGWRACGACHPFLDDSSELGYFATSNRLAPGLPIGIALHLAPCGQRHRGLHIGPVHKQVLGQTLVHPGQQQTQGLAVVGYPPGHGRDVVDQPALIHPAGPAKAVDACLQVPDQRIPVPEVVRPSVDHTRHGLDDPHL
jgi:hypothetical protein